MKIKNLTAQKAFDNLETVQIDDIASKVLFKGFFLKTFF